MYNFDNPVNRKNTGCIKYDFAKEHGFSEDVLPLWVADMDFSVPNEVIDALVSRMKHGIFGYTETKESYFDAVSAWMKNRHNWSVKPEWLVKTPGVVFAISMAVQAFTNEGDSVLIQPPVYKPFFRAVTANRRHLVENPLVLKKGRYEIDFNDFEQKIKSEKVKMFILCSPANPAGRVWKKDELEQIAQICCKNHVLVVSDEIHFDFVYPGNTHTVFSTVSDEIEQNCIVCTAPSKTFNLAGLQDSNIFIANPAIRKKFQAQFLTCGIEEINVAGLTACEAAYRYGTQWLDELLVYLKGNVDFMRNFLAENMSGVNLIQPEGTYLTWVDFRNLHFTAQELDERIRTKANLWLNDGAIFGKEGEKFQRINIACTRSTLKEAMNRLVKIL